MASVIKAGNATDGVQVTSDNTGILELKTGTGSGTTAVTIGTDQSVTFAQAANLPNTFGFKNRIINGAMVIDQRNAGASVALDNSNKYITDRFNSRLATSSGSTAIQSSVAPAGFTKSLLITIGTGASPASGALNWITQIIEGFNAADLGWGTANAQTITVSFWVRSSVTGTYAVSVANGSVNRSYVATYTVSAANTWEQKTVTIPGDTSGTWATDNTAGIYLFFDLGNGSTYQGTAGSWSGSWLMATSGSVKLVATSGATFYITGVQLEKGSTATSFDVRPYGTELQLCQRYYFRFNATESNWLGGTGYSGTTTTARVPITFPVQMRIPPTAIDTTGTASNYRILPANVALSAVPAFNQANQTDGWLSLTVASGLTANAVATMSAAAGVSTAFIGWSAEL